MARKPKEAKPKKPFNRDAKIIAAIRKVWRYSPERLEALSLAAVGCKPKHRRCAICKQEINAKLVEVDHINSVVPLGGRKSWDEYIDRMFRPANELRVICENCHRVVTQKQREEKSAYKKTLKQPKAKPIKIKASNLFAPQVIKKAVLVASEEKNILSQYKNLFKKFVK